MPSFQSDDGHPSPVPLSERLAGRDLLNRNIAVHWPDELLYPAVVRGFHRRRCIYTLDYIDGDREYINLETVDWVVLPEGLVSPCAQCSEEIDLSVVFSMDSGYLVCSTCASVYHFECMPRNKVYPPSVADATKWVCSPCRAESRPANEVSKPLLSSVIETVGKDSTCRLKGAISVFSGCDYNGTPAQCPYDDRDFVRPHRSDIVDEQKVVLRGAPESFVNVAMQIIPGLARCASGEICAPTRLVPVLRAFRERYLHQTNLSFRGACFDTFELRESPYRALGSANRYDHARSRNNFNSRTNNSGIESMRRHESRPDLASRTRTEFSSDAVATGVAPFGTFGDVSRSRTYSEAVLRNARVLDRVRQKQCSGLDMRRIHCQAVENFCPVSLPAVATIFREEVRSDGQNQTWTSARHSLAPDSSLPSSCLAKQRHNSFSAIQHAMVLDLPQLRTHEICASISSGTMTDDRLFCKNVTNKFSIESVGDTHSGLAQVSTERERCTVSHQGIGTRGPSLSLAEVSDLSSSRIRQVGKHERLEGMRRISTSSNLHGSDQGSNSISKRRNHSSTPNAYGAPSLERNAKRHRSTKREFDLPTDEQETVSAIEQSSSRTRPPSSGFKSKQQDVVRLNAVLHRRRGREKRACAFCGLPGARPECEGPLLGPFAITKLKTTRSIYAHRNCVTWAPEVFEGPRGNRLHGVEAAFVRARRAKCFVCGGLGGSLSCMFRMTACCKPMHFRCALVGGAALLAFSNAFQTLCPTHADRSVDPGREPCSRELRHVQTPLPSDFFSVDRLCTVCSGDNFNPAVGALLECSVCPKRMHSRCVLPLVQYDGVFAVDSAEKRFRCPECRQCFICMRPLSPQSSREQQNISCVGCQLVCIHASCSRDVGASEILLPNTRLFRCELCRTCQQCGVYRVPLTDWDEDLRACRDCSELYKSGVVCPICDKIYVEDEDSDMIQCDSCDKWIHVEDCCGLSQEQYEELRKTDAKYVCALCKGKRKRNKKKCVTQDDVIVSTDIACSKDYLELASTQAVNASVKALDMDDLDTALNCQDDSEFITAIDNDFIVWFNASRGSSERESLQGSGLAPCIDLCRFCGSTGSDKNMRFCASCGDGYHRFCLSAPLPEVAPFESVLTSSPGTLRRLVAGGLDCQAPYWHCLNCAVCAFCGTGSFDDDSAPSKLYRCDRCYIYSHVNCFPGSRLVQVATEACPKLMTCADCRTCELCGIQKDDFVTVCDRMFCRPCGSALRDSKSCSLCSIPFPLPGLAKDSFSGIAGLMFEGRSSQGKEGWCPVFRVCTVCSSVVHTSCDPISITVAVGEGYVCVPCRSSTQPQRRDRNLLRSSSSRLSSGNTRLVNYKIESSDTKNAVALSQSSIASEVSISRDPFSASLVDIASPCARGATIEAGLNCVYDDGDWMVNVEDTRRCEFCEEPEVKDSVKGRLLPWTSELGITGASTNLWWVHAMCAIWSRGISHRCVARKPHGILCILSASRRDMSALLRKSVCEVCRQSGATIICCYKDCEMRYHFTCARESGCSLQAITNLGDMPFDNAINLANVVSFSMHCPLHSNENSDVSTLAEEPLRGSLTISSACQLDMNCPIRFCNIGNKNRRPAVSSRYRLRVGGLMVLRPGRLVPDSALFVSKSALIPTEYRAARRYWSLRFPGRRCTYLLETSGTARSGPSFTIRASDDPSLKIVAPTADASWRSIVSALEIARLSRHPQTATLDYTVCASGEQLFGLSGNSASVSMIEQLPMSALFKERYDFQHLEPDFVKDLPFLLPRMIHSSPLNLSGCVRTEGYVPSRHCLAKPRSSCPTYSNVMSGERFQLHVAMGLVHGTRCGNSENTADQKTVHCGPVSAIYKPKGRAGVGDDLNRTFSNCSHAHLPHAMQHRTMLSTWQRRTVVLRSRIDGWGVFATEDILPLEMVIEYAGELIRPALSDRRELHYDRSGIGCYMFEIEPGVIVDATTVGNRARFINHSCDPNCFSRVVTVENSRRVIVIFSKRLIRRGEELCYDYQFPLDENDRVACACGSSRCKGYMN